MLNRRPYKYGKLLVKLLEIYPPKKAINQFKVLINKVLNPILAQNGRIAPFVTNTLNFIYLRNKGKKYEKNISQRK